jgi:hypothetical protein
VVPTPQPGTDHADKLLAVDAAAINDVWATGVYQDARYRDHSLVLHWNGSAWRQVPLGTPRPSSGAWGPCDTYGGLTGITVVGAADIWAVGDATTCHYNGVRWTEVPSPQPEYPELSYPLEDVSAASSSDVWAVGARVTDSPYELYWDALAEHWDGAQWSRVRALPAGQILLGVEAVAGNDVWAVGRDEYGPVIIHYDGVSWSSVATPEARRAGRLAGIDSAAADDLWAAGSYLDGALIEHAPSSTQGAVEGHTNVSFATVSWFGPENGSVETNDYGDYQVGGLDAGSYMLTATEPGCTPASQPVTVVAGATLEVDLHINCSRPRVVRSPRAHSLRRHLRVR